MPDVVVIGGGVIGLSIAYELAGQGAQVSVLDQADIGREASWAGAGMLPPGNVAGARTPEARLRSLSHSRWPELTAELRELTGIDNEFRCCGGFELALGSPQSLRHEIDRWRDEGVKVQPLEREELRWQARVLGDAIHGGYYLPEFAQVRNPRHLRALLAGCVARGVRLQPGTPVQGFECKGPRVLGVQVPDGILRASEFVITAGAWSKALLQGVDCRMEVTPVRGQMVLLSLPAPLFPEVLTIGSRYLVPRLDGRILVGSTEEHVGFHKQNTTAGISGLLALAQQLVPALAGADFERAWAGLRPGSADGLPYLGRVPHVENLTVATGHFRSGLQMSAGTAILISQLIRGITPEIPLKPYACGRDSPPISG